MARIGVPPAQWLLPNMYGRPLKNVSPSQVVARDACPSRWHFHKAQGIEDPSPKPAAELGTKLHDELEQWIKSSKAPKSPLVLPALDYMPDPGTPGVEAEQAMMLEIVTPRGVVTMLGFIDLTERSGNRITDYKTSSDPERWVKKAEQLPTDVQTGSYSYWYLTTHGAKIVEFRLLAIATRGRPRAFPVTLRWSAAEIAAAWDAITAKVRELVEDFYRPIEEVAFDTSHCFAFGKPCFYKGYCYAMGRDVNNTGRGERGTGSIFAGITRKKEGKTMNPLAMLLGGKKKEEPETPKEIVRAGKWAEGSDAGQPWSVDLPDDTAAERFDAYAPEAQEAFAELVLHRDSDVDDAFETVDGLLARIAESEATAAVAVEALPGVNPPDGTPDSTLVTAADLAAASAKPQPFMMADGRPLQSWKKAELEGAALELYQSVAPGHLAGLDLGDAGSWFTAGCKGKAPKRTDMKAAIEAFHAYLGTATEIPSKAVTDTPKTGTISATVTAGKVAEVIGDAPDGMIGAVVVEEASDQTQWANDLRDALIRCVQGNNNPQPSNRDVAYAGEAVAELLESIPDASGERSRTRFLQRSLRNGPPRARPVD